MVALKYLFLLCSLWFGYVAWSDFSYHVLPDGSKLRVGSWKSTQSPKGTIVLMVGRGSYMEKNLDFIHALNAMGFDVETFDWRGHGGSERLLSGSQKCHIDSFETYLNDFDDYFSKVLKKRISSAPLYLMGVSMGGHLAARYLHDHPQAFNKAILVVPMFDVITKPFPKAVVQPLATFMTILPFSTSYAFGYGDVNLTGPIPPESKETHSKERHLETHKLMRQYPHLVVAGPTFGWVKAAFDSMALTENSNYLRAITTPVLLQTAGQDGTVDSEKDQERCKKMKNCQYMVYKDSRHNITKEIDTIREPFLKDINTFLSQS